MNNSNECCPGMVPQGLTHQMDDEIKEAAAPIRLAQGKAAHVKSNGCQRQEFTISAFDFA